MERLTAGRRLENHEIQCALHLAFLQAQERIAANCLKQYRSLRQSLLNKGKVWGYKETVATTWGISFQAVEAEAPEANAEQQTLSVHRLVQEVVREQRVNRGAVTPPGFSPGCCRSSVGGRIGQGGNP